MERKNQRIARAHARDRIRLIGWAMTHVESHDLEGVRNEISFEASRFGFSESEVESIAAEIHSQKAAVHPQTAGNNKPE